MSQALNIIQQVTFILIQAEFDYCGQPQEVMECLRIAVGVGWVFDNSDIPVLTLRFSQAAKGWVFFLNHTDFRALP